MRTQRRTAARSGADNGEWRGSGRKIVVGQHLDAGKALRARDFRRNPTPEELLLWKALRANQLCDLHFRRQQVIDGFIADFYCDAAGLVVELDGRAHEQRAGYDEARDACLVGHGLRVIRISNEDVTNDLASVLERIAAEAERRAKPARPPTSSREASRRRE